MDRKLNTKFKSTGLLKNFWCLKRKMNIIIKSTNSALKRDKYKTKSKSFTKKGINMIIRFRGNTLWRLSIWTGICKNHRIWCNNSCKEVEYQQCNQFKPLNLHHLRLKTLTTVLLKQAILHCFKMKMSHLETLVYQLEAVPLELAPNWKLKLLKAYRQTSTKKRLTMNFKVNALSLGKLLLDQTGSRVILGHESGATRLHKLPWSLICAEWWCSTMALYSTHLIFNNLRSKHR